MTGTIDGIALICDMQGMVRDVVRDDFGIVFPRPRAEETHFSELIDEDNRAKALQFLDDIRARGACFLCELPMRCKQGVEVLYFGGSLFRDEIALMASNSPDDIQEFYHEFLSLTREQARLLLSTLHNGPRLRQADQGTKRLYEELSRVNNELVNAQRELHKKNVALANLVKQRDMFLGMAAHDLRNPLGIILTYSDCLLSEMRPALGAEHAEMLGSIGVMSNFMLDLVEQLLDISKIESGRLTLHKSPTDIIRLFERTVTLNRVLARSKGMTLLFEAETPLPLLMTDQVKIVQVLNNLLGNAIKYAPAESTVRIRLRIDGEQVQFSVHNEGPGIPQDKQEAIFQPFSRLGADDAAPADSAGKGLGRGAGLGLVIVRKIVEGHGGQIRVESAPGQGVTFVVRLPFEPAPVPQPSPTILAPPAPAQEANRSAGPRSVRILLAEDDPMLAQMMQRLLEKRGHTVVRVENGLEGLAVLSGTRFDLALLDIQMPGLDGLELAERIRDEDSAVLDHRLPLLGLTGMTGEEERNKALQAGMNGYLTKPVSSQELFAAIAGLVDHSDRTSDSWEQSSTREEERS